ncbi:isocitrate lyase/PEP mutase family protein [Chitinophaga nivalis]|uniref:Isocitrate lyase/phosphoenolpyruvate mutase family protein n=1 Tax=Chitinophaga nivalis TaxID=2991709 RepID=A0ABT3IM68_9BACT|nr:isocitrate lyase/phosphoenolpyruvate mutase family protein [Chitinophaga nivalis]MCW3465248.1 isocitrate lyase/phosphoenolpyruvate mutase family protein [Chitinophaga nivalis]MCW3485060.1 isocitrate lyase/phosphoenolpyruvate mutase family protein [Chitinophaga nivalis]
MSNYNIFKQLHQESAPLLLGNAWNVASARILEESGIKAIGTSSSAIADTLGYEDGEHIPFDELFFIIEKIARHVRVPLSADIESGYSKEVATVIQHIERLYNIGVVGINLEDSIAAARELVPTDIFRRKVETIKNYLVQQNMDFFLNIRTDTFLLDIADPLPETFARIHAFEQAGADGIFVPFIKKPEDIRQVTAATSLPVNVLSMHGLPSFEVLQEAGVKRISMGGSVYRAVYKGLTATVQEIVHTKSFNPVF